MIKKSASHSTQRGPDKWAEHRRWLKRAEAVAHRAVSRGGSPHPFVRVGAVLVDSMGREIASAANRFAHGVDRRRSERTKVGQKSLWINCAEQLALMQALREGRSIKGSKLYVTLEPCAVCAGMIAELRVSEIFVPVGAMRRYAKLKSKWKESIEVGLVKLEESGVRVIPVDTERNPKKNRRTRSTKR